MPEIKSLESGKLICLETVGNLQAQGALFTQIQEYLKSRRVSMRGERLILLYDDPLTVDRTHAHYAAALELAGETVGDGELTIVIQSVMQVACEMYRGPQANLGEAYQRLYQWIQEKGYEGVGPVREYYFSKDVLDMDNLEIEMQIPVRRRL